MILANIRRIEDVLRIVIWSDDLYDSSEFKNQLQEKIIELKKELDILPIGHEYQGVYYKKTSDGFVKMEGQLFMREDLVSWIDPTIKDSIYMRSIYIEPSYDKELTREHGKPVFKPINSNNRFLENLEQSH